MTFTSPPSMIETTEFVVPKSIPITFSATAMMPLLVTYVLLSS